MFLIWLGQLSIWRHLSNKKISTQPWLNEVVLTIHKLFSSSTNYSHYPPIILFIHQFLSSSTNYPHYPPIILFNHQFTNCSDRGRPKPSRLQRSHSPAAQDESRQRLSEFREGSRVSKISEISEISELRSRIAHADDTKVRRPRLEPPSWGGRAAWGCLCPAHKASTNFSTGGGVDFLNFRLFQTCTNEPSTYIRPQGC